MSFVVQDELKARYRPSDVEQGPRLGLAQRRYSVFRHRNTKETLIKFSLSTGNIE